MLVNHAPAPSLDSIFYKRLLELDLSDPRDVEQELHAALRFLADVTGSDLAYLEISDIGHEMQIGYAARTQDEPLLAEPRQLLLANAEAPDGPPAAQTQLAAHSSPSLSLEALQQPLAATAWVRLAPITGVVYLRRPTPFTPAGLEALELFARRITEELVQSHGAESLSLQTATQRFKRHRVLTALERTKWNISKAARELVVARSYLYKLIHQMNLRAVQEGEQA